MPNCERLTSLPNNCILRPAHANDMPIIRKFVSRARLDPTNLHWSQFWVIQYEEQIVAIGRLRNLINAQELASLFVAPTWRSQGLGTYLAQHLIKQATQPLYLKCRADKLVPFYSRLGFVPVSWQTLPKSLKWKFGLTEIVGRMLQIPLTTMQYQRGAN